MKKKLFAFCLILTAGWTALCAQSQVRYGTLRYDSVLHALPEYAEALTQLAELRSKYEAETAHNETVFRRMFAEFLQGQKDFPQNIMLKRQRDLQDEMEKSVSFRREADSLLRQAEADMLAPARRRLDAALHEVGTERGYECIVDAGSLAAGTGPYLFLHPSLTEDATPFVLEKLGLTEAP